jgi:hypothetical protein
MTRSRFATPLSAVLICLALAGCRANDAAPQAGFSGSSKNVISDGDHNSGTPGFYFLPPMVPQPGNFGPFRPEVLPTVQIDQVTLSPAGCTSDCQATVVRANVAHWTRFWGSDWRRIRVHLTSSWGGWRGWDDDDDGDDGDDAPEGYFVVRWDSDDFGVTVHGIYRVRVMVPSNGGQLELGYSDIEIVANKKQFRRVDTTEYTALIDGRTLKIKFRIDTPALACVDVTCPSGNDCRSAGFCDPHIGQCTTVQKPAGSACTADDNPCTSDVCDAAGECVHPAANAGVQCRAATGVCELPAACDGVNTACPANRFQPSTVVCRASAGACDAAETCNGSSAACPPDDKLPATTMCRASAGACGGPASCDGVSNDCPANGLAPAGTVCRAAAGPCESAAACDGVSGDCPANAAAPAGTVCRAAAGPCESAAACDGVSGDCPANAGAPAGTVCRASAGACDGEEKCDGRSAACPADAKLPAATVCRAAGGACESPASCDGVSNGCPANGVAPAGTVCRGSAGACDVEERCTGASAACPADGKLPSGTMCRLAQGDCDLPASCDGSRDECPANGFQANTVVCREAVGSCDVPETCTGSDAFCPADRKVRAGTVCRAAAGECDAAEACDGVDSACPADAFQQDGAFCQNVCSPTLFVCRAKACVPSITQCPPGFNDGGDGTCLPSGPAVCALDDFNGSELDAHWNTSAVGRAPSYTLTDSFLLIGDAAFADTPSFGGSWIYDPNFDLGNQMAWRQPIGVNDFDVKFTMAWDSRTGDGTLAGIGITNANDQLELRAGLEAPGDVGIPLVELRDNSGWFGDVEESGIADVRLTRSGGVLTIEFRGATVFCGPFTADIRNLVIYTVRGQFVGVDYPFGEFDLDSVQVCRPTLTCAAGFVDLGNGHCEQAVSSGP